MRRHLVAVLVCVCALAGCGERVVARSVDGRLVAASTMLHVERPFNVGHRVRSIDLCPFGRRLSRRQCDAVAVYIGRVVLAEWFAAVWAWDHPPSPGFVSWDCVGTAETGNVYSTHGSEYSGPFGMLNQAVRERADTPEVAARILAGTASPGEQRRAAWREDLAFGPGAWGVLTRAKCQV